MKAERPPSESTRHFNLARWQLSACLAPLAPKEKIKGHHLSPFWDYSA